MQHNTLPNDIRPGEEVLANRIRQSLPATVRDMMLPPADADLVREVRRCYGECNQETAFTYVRTTVHVVDETITATERELVRRRTETYFERTDILFQRREG